MLRPHLDLEPGEAIVWTSHRSWWTQFGLLSLGTLLLPAFGIGFFAFAVAWWRVWSTTFWVTNRRIVLRRGILARREVEVPIRRIDAITVEQDLFERALGYGQIQISVEGTDTAQLRGTCSPVAVRSAIRQVQAALIP